MKTISKKLIFISFLLALSTLVFGYFTYDNTAETSKNETEKAQQNDKIRKLEKEIDRLQDKRMVESLLDKIEKKNQKDIVNRTRNEKFRQSNRVKTYDRNIDNRTKLTHETHSNESSAFKHKLTLVLPDIVTSKYLSKVITKKNYETNYQNNKDYQSSYTSSYKPYNNNSSTYSSGSGYTNPDHVYVNGYTRKNGTYVQGHYRTKSNGNKSDNFSTKGNKNPYTGKKGYK